MAKKCSKSAQNLKIVLLKLWTVTSKLFVNTGMSIFTEVITTETGRLFFRRRAKQLPLQRNIFELSSRDLSLTPQM